MNINLTSEAYQNYKHRLFGMTFSERFLTVHYVMPKKDKDAWVAQEEAAKAIHYNGQKAICDIAKKAEIPSKYLSIIKSLARQFSYASLTSSIANQDLIKATLRANAALNKRNLVCIDDFKFIMMVRPYLTNPFSPYEAAIVKYTAQGLSELEICEKIGKQATYRQQVRRVIKKAEVRGVLDIQSPQKGDVANSLKRR